MPKYIGLLFLCIFILTQIFFILFFYPFIRFSLKVPNKNIHFKVNKQQGYIIPIEYTNQNTSISYFNLTTMTLTCTSSSHPLTAVKEGK